MEQIAEQITESLIQELPNKTDFFTPQELLSCGISSVVIETLRNNVATTVESGMNMPASDWIQTDSEKVLAAWEVFKKTSKEHIKIPAARISVLLEEAVEQCLKLALKPREFVPEFIFKSGKTIDLEAVKTRVAELELNQQLGLALLRYMERKEKSELTIDQARELIKKIDEKLVEDYHPLNWAQALKSVFELAGPSVNPDLFRIFFEDKGMHGVARKFDLLENQLNETEFIEFMSSPELLDVDDFEDPQPELFVPVDEDDSQHRFDEEEGEGEDETDPELFEEENGSPEPADEGESEEEIFFEDEDEDEDENIDEFSEEEPKTLQQVETEDTPFIDEESEAEESVEDDFKEESDEKEENIVDLFSHIQKGEAPEGDLYYLEENEEKTLSLVEPEDESGGDEDNITLLNKFIFDESESDDDDDLETETQIKKDEKKEPSSIYEEMNLVKEDRQRTERMSEVFDERSDEENVGEDDDEEEQSDEGFSYKIEPREEEEDLLEKSQPSEDEIEKNDEENEDELPMWRSFLERDDLESESSYEYEEEDASEEPLDEEGFIEEPIYDLTVAEPDPEEKLLDVTKWLDDEKDRYVSEIFRDSETAYEQALIEILDFNDWKSASHYLEREVFSRNRIDVYDEAAVDFTDRLHSYFMENKS